jgi:hypothetical protein
MRAASWIFLLVGICIATRAPAWADRADWQQWVYEEAKTTQLHRSAKFPLGLMEPGAVAAMVQFGYAYCRERDTSLHAPQKDFELVKQLSPDLLRKVPQLDTADGIQFVEVLAEQAQRRMCP